MSTCTPTPIRRALPDDELLKSARARRQLTDTALTATGGGELRELRADPADGELWHARVRCPDGRQLVVQLDRRVGAVLVRDAGRRATRAA